MMPFSRFMLFGAALILVSSLSSAETTCSKNGCDITITIKMAFSGTNDTYINNAKNEIESFWNGPSGFRPVGDCKCKMTVKVETKKVADCVNNPPAGYHCIAVTNFFKPDGTYDNPPRNQTNITGARIYVGYVYGIARGNGGNNQKGWFSDQMSRPVNPNNPGGQRYADFAHEAGHLMGLDHNGNASSIMNNTLVAGPSQQDLDGAAQNICGDNYCPDSCCCGNGKVDKDKGENCDPAANPTECAAGASCCPVCCQCYKPLCIAANGEYLSLSDCQNSCGAGSSCYKNYKSGCWDCLEQSVIVTGTCSDPTIIRGNETCDHVATSFAIQSADFYKNGLAYAPVIGSVFANERINIKTAEGDTGHLVTKDGNVTDFGTSLLSDPTVTLSTDQETVRLIAGERMSVQQALSSGKIRIEGNDFFSGFKFWAYKFSFDVYNFFNPAEEFVEPAVEPDLPQDYFDAMKELNQTGPAEGTPMQVGTGAPPDVWLPESVK